MHRTTSPGTRALPLRLHDAVRGNRIKVFEKSASTLRQSLCHRGVPMRCVTCFPERAGCLPNETVSEDEAPCTNSNAQSFAHVRDSLHEHLWDGAHLYILRGCNAEVLCGFVPRVQVQKVHSNARDPFIVADGPIIEHFRVLHAKLFTPLHAVNGLNECQNAIIRP